MKGIIINYSTKAIQQLKKKQDKSDIKDLYPTEN